MSAMVSQITGVSIVCWTICSGANQRKHQSSPSMAFVKGIHRWPVDSPHKAPIMRKMMTSLCILTTSAAVNDQKFENEKFRCIQWREFHQNDGISVLVYPYIHPWLMVRVSRELVDWKRGVPTVYPKKYAHGFCFAVLCCGYTLTDFPIFIRLTSLALWQSNDCPSTSKATLMNMDKYFMWIHYERLHNHNKAKHNKTVCIFLGIYCMARRR